MFFNNKNKKSEKCENCGEYTQKKFSFCPSCGNSLNDTMKEKEDFGLLGKDDFSEVAPESPFQNLTITDKLVGSIMNSMMINLDKQFREMEKQMENAEIKTFPNGVRIKISGPFSMQPARQQKQKLPKPTVEPETMKKISSLPREKAKTSVKRFGNKIVYEMATPGVSSIQDIFISKIESGYEVKAVGNKKVYVNSIPLNLPIRKYSIINDKLSVEFVSQEN